MENETFGSKQKKSLWNYPTQSTLSTFFLRDITASLEIRAITHRKLSWRLNPLNFLT